VFEGASAHEERKSSATYVLDSCVSCNNISRENEKFDTLHARYHQNDFVYYRALEGVTRPKPFCIGQIVGLDVDLSQTVTIRKFHRHDDFLELNPSITNAKKRVQADIFKDCRRLVLTDVTETVPIVNLDSMCRVRFFSEEMMKLAEFHRYKDGRDCFWFMDYLLTETMQILSGIRQNSPEQLCRIRKNGKLYSNAKVIAMPEACSICENQRSREEELRDEFFRTQRKLRAMDLFSGCGGLSCGLEQTGMIETRYAIELDKAAAATFR